MRAIFFGTPAIAVPALNALSEIAEVSLVICQPDRPSGRGLELKIPPVKARALELSIPVLQPDKVRTPEFAERIRQEQADVALVIAYGRILPPAVLRGPKQGCLNLHASLLPKLRGAAPITWAIVRGESETGISLMQMDEGCDTGPVYTMHRIPIGENTSADELTISMGELAASVVKSDLMAVLRGEIQAQPQDNAEATLAPILKKEDGKIDWQKNAREVHNHIRGMNTWPGAFTSIEGKLLKVLETRVLSDDTDSGGTAPGTVVEASKHGITIACGRGRIAILRAQLEGKKALAAPDLVAGRSLREGMKLGG